MALDKTHLKVQFSRLVRKASEGNELTENELAQVKRLAIQLNTIWEAPGKLRNKTKRPKVRKSKAQTQSHWNGVNKV